MEPQTEKLLSNEEHFDDGYDSSDEDVLEYILEGESDNKKPYRPWTRHFSTPWLKTVFITLLTIAFAITWLVTLSLAWRIATEQAQATCSVGVNHQHSQSTAATPASSYGHGGHGSHASPERPQHTTSYDEHNHADHEQGNEGPKPYLNVPGFELTYNRTFCDGVADIDGAVSRGCVFDPIHGGWVPQLCHDKELWEDFTTSYNWDWFLDEELTQPIEQTAVWRGEGRERTYTTDDFHFRHCEFILKTLIKSHTTNGPALGFKVMDRDHLEHCLDRLINSNTPEIRNAFTETVVWTKSAECYSRIAARS